MDSGDDDFDIDIDVDVGVDFDLKFGDKELAINDADDL
jgi:hypothetical protein